MAIGHAVVYHAWAAHAFSTGIKCRYCISFLQILRKEDMGMLFTGKVGEEVMYTFPNSLVPQYLKLLEK